MSVAAPNASRAIALKVASVFLFVVMASLIKFGSRDVPPGEAVFFRSLFALPVIFGWLALKGELADGWKTQNPLGHLWRGLIGTSAMAMSFACSSPSKCPSSSRISYLVPSSKYLVA